MKHHRSPTHSYPHAALALPHTTVPTLLSPLRTISNTSLDDFQSNAWISPCTPLAGLGISYESLYDDPFPCQDSAYRLQVDGDQELLSLLTDSHSERTESRCVVQFTSNLDPSLCDEHIGRVALGFDNDLDPLASAVVGLIPDVNMYDRFRQDFPYTGVNPLDTICSASLHDVEAPYAAPVSLTPEDHDNDDIPFATDSKPTRSPSPRLIHDIMSILVQPTPEFSFPPWVTAKSPPASSQLPSPRPYAPIKLEPPHVPDCEPQISPAPSKLECTNTTLPSPVFNAHLGIELGELIARAERFRVKHPERDIDRAWLSHFAGKLSERGELLNDFRCYVIGCDQRNKRRDHILVHVGAHIGQRPFACSMCSLRFLRKNECKRHEASHSGFRPYSCDICGQSFVRQDLVKRHVKRTHGIKDENQTSVAGQPRKKPRLA